MNRSVAISQFTEFESLSSLTTYLVGENSVKIDMTYQYHEG
eukprot:SAG11_NODE_1083_length_5951_cov_7.969925_6_plen_41_part_00